MGYVLSPGRPLPLVLPPSFDKQTQRYERNVPVDMNTFYDYIDEAVAICGAENVTVVSSHDEHTANRDYENPSKVHDMFHIFDKEYFLSSAVIAPRKVSEVQEVLQLSNRFHIPLWPFSIGRNVGYGGAAPRVPGSIGLDMGRNFNKIEIDEQNACCLLEPGVTYTDLYEHLKANGLHEKLWIDVPDLGGGSVLGNCIERGVGYTPYGDHFMMHSGLEVVLPSGELVRTGMGAMPNPEAGQSNVAVDEQPGNKSWQLFPYGFGPYIDGMFSQSNLGVITKMGMGLMPNPGGYQSYLVTFQNEADLNPIVEKIRKMRLSMVIGNVPSIRHILLDAAVLGDRASYSSSDKPLTEEELVAIQKKLGLGRWNFYGAMYGPEAIRAEQWKVIEAEFGAIPGAEFHWPKEGETRGVLDIRSKTLAGIPSSDELKWVDWLENGSHWFFSPISEVTGEQADLQYSITKKRVLDAGFDFFGTFTIGMREMHHIVCLVFNREDPDQRRRVHALFRQLINDCAKHGWGEYRTHLAAMDQVAGTYNFNDGALWKLHGAIKDSFDPNGILAPGKNGVWGRNYEKSEWSLDKDLAKL